MDQWRDISLAHSKALTWRQSIDRPFGCEDGIDSLHGLEGYPDQAAILGKVIAFDQFTEDNDPHGEHDFGAFDHAGQRIFWKIDYYDPPEEFGSEDPTDPTKTTRVLTIMLADANAALTVRAALEGCVADHLARCARTKEPKVTLPDLI
jgi:hypothetical protein